VCNGTLEQEMAASGSLEELSYAETWDDDRS
jgi:hypothetical protein